MTNTYAICLHCLSPPKAASKGQHCQVEDVINMTCVMLQDGDSRRGVKHAGGPENNALTRKALHELAGQAAVGLVPEQAEAIIPVQAPGRHIKPSMLIADREQLAAEAVGWQTRTDS